MFRNFTFSDVEEFGELLLAAVAMLAPVVAIALLLTT